MRRIAAIAIASMLSACAHAPPVSASDPTCGWDARTIDTAKRAWLYAQLAYNVYLDEPGDPPDFRFGDEVVELDSKDNDEIGLAYAVFERKRSGLPAEWIIAFRGTEGFFGKEGRKDWRHANFGMAQQRRGMTVYDQWLKKSQEAGQAHAFTATGHSLGGGIAIQISLCRHAVTAYVFNSSPRFRSCGERIDNDRYSITEYGEILKLPRIFGREATQQYTSIGCVDRANPVKQHQMRRLAECLTRIAAVAGKDEAASRSLDRNPEVPKDCWPRGRRRV